MSTSITVEGMSCEGCEQNVEDALEAIEGVTDADADRTEESATVEGDASVEALIDAVREAGYDAHL
ncbi:MAG: heavy-metal-associated domain-containing protein [Haloarculaceae archaeon]